ncbi:transcriptional regulator [Brevibacterium zhoupengii]|uniref:transcriptional regulator n=1 Tax=Brevibacterium zhoupengii TaxID=2898795 RepID=UPI001E6186A8|nr:transcriptional regulator [Brevibacterium zhoupengii]
MERVRFRDLKPYEVVASLDDLHGPAKGTISLPIWVRWLDDGDIDLTDLGGARLAYQALLAEGTDAIQAQLMNKEILLRLWPQLSLDSRVRNLWEERFPELRVVHT